MKQAHVRLPLGPSEGRPNGPRLRPVAPGRGPEKRGLLASVTGQHGPELALLGILAATAGIGFKDRLPVLSVGIHLQVPDVLLLGSLVWIAARWLAVPEFRIVRTPLNRPLLIFYGVTLLSTLSAVLHSSVVFDQAIEKIRIFSYYLCFFVVTNLVRERRQLKFLLNGMFVLATIVALAMIGQYVLGGSIQLLQNNQEPEEITFGAAVRIAPPGFSIVLVSLVTIFCTLVTEKVKPAGLLRFVQCGLLGLAFVVTFFRSYSLALAIVTVLLVFLFRGDDRRRLLGWATILMFPAVLALVAVFTAPDLPVSKLLDAWWDRLSTVGESGAFTGGDLSYDYRRLENEYAFAAIAAHPVLGQGMGASFRPLDRRLDPIDDTGIHDLTNHIHNGHLGVLVQSGLLGYLSLMWLSVVFLRRGLRNWRKVPDERLRGIVLGFTVVYLALVIAAGANSVFVLPYWTPVIGIVMGINEAILRTVKAK